MIITVRPINLGTFNEGRMHPLEKLRITDKFEANVQRKLSLEVREHHSNRNDMSNANFFGRYKSSFSDRITFNQQ